MKNKKIVTLCICMAIMLITAFAPTDNTTNTPNMANNVTIMGGPNPWM